MDPCLVPPTWAVILVLVPLMTLLVMVVVLVAAHTLTAIRESYRDWRRT